MPDTNIAQGKLAFMSSLYGTRVVATKGNDGKDNTHFRTARGDQAWWAVDLGQGDDLISRVKITNIEGERKCKCLKVVL